MRLYGCVGVPLAVHSPLALWIGGEDGFDDGKRRCDEEGVDQDQGNAGEHGDSVEHVHLMAGSSGWQAMGVYHALCWARACSGERIFRAQGHAHTQNTRIDMRDITVTREAQTRPLVVRPQVVESAGLAAYHRCVWR